jgi:hypothetical protein
MYPSVPCTRMRCPSLINHGAGNHQPTHLGHQALDGHEQGLGSVKVVTRISPASSSASAMSERTRARPSTTPAETGDRLLDPRIVWDQ